MGLDSSLSFGSYGSFGLLPMWQPSSAESIFPSPSLSLPSAHAAVLVASVFVMTQVVVVPACTNTPEQPLWLALYVELATSSTLYVPVATRRSFCPSASNVVVATPFTVNEKSVGVVVPFPKTFFTTRVPIVDDVATRVLVMVQVVVVPVDTTTAPQFS